MAAEPAPLEVWPVDLLLAAGHLESVDLQVADRKRK
jgi:hypothetical protein